MIRSAIRQCFVVSAALPRVITFSSICLFVLGLPATASAAAGEKRICAGQSYDATYVVVRTETDFTVCGRTFNNVWILTKPTEAARRFVPICSFSAIPADYVVVGNESNPTTCQVGADRPFDNILWIADVKDSPSVCYFSPIPDGYVVVGSGLGFTKAGSPCHITFQDRLWPLWQIERARDDQAICRFSPIPSGFAVVGSTITEPLCLGQDDPFAHYVIARGGKKIDGLTTTWVGRVTVTEPECGGGGTIVYDLTLTAQQSGSAVNGTFAVKAISAPKCTDAIGFSDVLPFIGNASGSLSIGSGTVNGAVGLGDQSGTLTARIQGAQMTGTVVFVDGASGSFDVKRQ
jgi:hypothetical protein